MGLLMFDEAEARRTEAIYGIGDAVRRRAIVRRALGAAPGEDVLDVGCGPGFYCAELLQDVGPDGSVTGVDRSPAMLALARRRCAELGNVELREGEATALPVEDAGADAALSVQVMEYVEDVGAALAEMRRALRPGGRALVWDLDWATVSLHAEDGTRSARVLAAWDEHLVHRSLPRTLAPLMRQAGFEDVRMAAHPFATATFDGDSYGVAIIPLVAAFAAGRAGVTEAEAEGWADDLRELGARAAFFFSCTQFCFTARAGG